MARGRGRELGVWVAATGGEGHVIEAEALSWGTGTGLGIREEAGGRVGTVL